MNANLFENKVYAVTGGGTGIGLAIVTQLATAGSHVYALDVHETQTSELAAIGSERVSYIQCDVRDRKTCSEAVRKIILEHGRLDGMVNNAGVCELEGELPSDEIYDKIMDINVRGVWNMGTEAIVQMKAQGFGGSIVNIGSTSCLKGEHRLPVYTASKHAVAGFTRVWALDQGQYKIRVNCVAPGPTDTNMARGPIQTVMGPKYGGNKTDDELLDLVAQNMPNRRMGQPQDVANLVLFLMSDLGIQVTGQILCVSGGF